jgi:Flp pilus assembly protein TadB
VRRIGPVLSAAQAAPPAAAWVDALARAVGIPSPSAEARHRIVGTAALAALALPLAPPLSAAIAAGSWLRHRQRRMRATRELARSIRRALPDAVDLLLLCTGAGLSLPAAHPLVATRVDGPLGESLRSAAVEADGGRARADALHSALAALGDRPTALAHVLADHLRYGAALAPSLERLSAELRLDQRRHAEEDARRVPVRLLGPLVACTLPAFALLTVVPLLAASLRALPT